MAVETKRAAKKKAATKKAPAAAGAPRKKRAAKATGKPVAHKKSGKPAKVSQETGGAGEVVTLLVDQCHALPENPEPVPENVAKLVESLKSRGQDEPIVVRPAELCEGYEVPAGDYQVLAGHDRLAAFRSLGWNMVDARIRTDIVDQQEAVAWAAGHNADRRAVSLFESAAMLLAMCRAGSTQAEAGKVYNISRSEVSNRIRMLTLPPVWRQRVTSGELLPTVARLFLPFVDDPAVMELLEASWNDPRERVEFARRDTAEQLLPNADAGDVASEPDESRQSTGGASGTHAVESGTPSARVQAADSNPSENTGKASGTQTQATDQVDEEPTDRVQWTTERLGWLWDKYRASYGEDADWMFFRMGLEKFTNTRGAR